MVKQISEQGLKWFQNARFGMFIHWGLYSILAKQEWIMHIDRIPVSEYEKLVPQFNPIKFNAEEWVSIAADAGQKYIVCTSRHHDGFSMYDTALSDYKVTNTPFGRDPIRELADACARRKDIKLGFYSSLLDWHHPAYRFRKESGLAWSDYIEFLHGQVRELCTNYGEIMCIWFDGDWPHELLDETNAYFKAGGSFEYEKLYDMIHTLQPDAAVLNNHHDEPKPGEDIQGFEQDLPGMNTAGFNVSSVSDKPLEVCMTINDHWGYCANDLNHKSSRHLVHLLARSASVGANYLLNVGPTAAGEILPIHSERLRNVGEWLQRNGEAIYGTSQGMIPATANSVSTCTDDAQYLHLLNHISDSITIENVAENIQQAQVLHSGETVQIEHQDGNLVITVPEKQRDPINTIIKLT